MKLRTAARRYLSARRDLHRAQKVLAAPFRDGEGIERRLRYAMAHGEPLYLTITEHDWLRAAARTGTSRDAVTPNLPQFDGVRVTVDGARARRQERETRPMTYKEHP